MSLTKIGTLTMFILSTLGAASVFASSELDRTSAAAPHGLVVRKDASGTVEFFKADVSAKVNSDAQASEAATQFAKDENRIAKVAPSSELDRSSSSEAWYYWYAPSYIGSYYYSYWRAGYTWNYYPSYSWYSRGYSYYYYYWY
ncbi:hypothetical protein WDW37_05685 [Bdellovibrionota bacterium FG-1]